MPNPHTFTGDPNISVSYLRAKKKNDLDRIMGLYGKSNEKYW